MVSREHFGYINGAFEARFSDVQARRVAKEDLCSVDRDDVTCPTGGRATTTGVVLNVNPYLIVSGDFVKTGGMDRANYALASYLVDSGVETHLVAHRVDESLAARSNLTVHRVAKPLGSNMLGEPFLDRAARRLASCIKSRSARVVTNGGNCGLRDVNWVHYVHAAYVPSVNSTLSRRIRNKLYYRICLAREAKAIRGARLVVANSKRTKTDLIEKLKIPESRVECVYYGIDAGLFRVPTPDQRAKARSILQWKEDNPVLLFVGALGDRRKGFDTLFGSYQRLCQDPRWDVHLAVVGTGPELSLWRQRIAAAGLSSRIEVLGMRADVPTIMAAADALVAPTRYEAYGLAVHEALCCGLPAVVSKGAGVAERYPSPLEGLLLNDPDNKTELADRLLNWRLKMDSYRAEVTLLADELCNYTWNDMAARIFELIEGQR
jgi:glycosyltransferase involved in cell wall biosynthesis